MKNNLEGEIVLVPVGEVSADVLHFIQEDVQIAFARTCRIADRLALLPAAYNPRRNQYRSDDILNILLPLRQPSQRILGITEVDLYTPGLNFVFGQASLQGGVAVIGLARLSPEFYGLPPDLPLLQQRAAKEAIHELGHTYGLGHCSDRRCVMSFSNSLAEADFKRKTFCSRCASRIRE